MKISFLQFFFGYQKNGGSKVGFTTGVDNGVWYKWYLAGVELVGLRASASPSPLPLLKQLLILSHT
jgi:hypothetical protein